MILKIKLVFVLLLGVLAAVQAQGRKQVMDLETLDKAQIAQESYKALRKQLTYDEGYYYSDQGQKTWCDIYRSKRLKQKNNFLFTIVREDGQTTVLTAYDIQGYWNGEALYKSYRTEREGMSATFFIKEVCKGKIELYEREAIASDLRFLYYMKFDGQDHLFVLDPFAQNVKIEDFSAISKANDAFGGFAVFTTKNLPEKFISFCMKYLYACPAVVNKVRSGFYTMHDLPDIVDEYNIWWENQNE